MKIRSEIDDSGVHRGPEVLDLKRAQQVTLNPERGTCFDGDKINRRAGKFACPAVCFAVFDQYMSSGGMAGPSDFFFSGFSATMASVVRSSPATDAAF